MGKIVFHFSGFQHKVTCSLSVMCPMCSHITHTGMAEHTFAFLIRLIQCDSGGWECFSQCGFRKAFTVCV